MVFAFAYFFSTLIRAITATLSPTLTQEFGLKASDLGLLAGGYFLGFSATQLPLGAWLDRHGPKRVILSFLIIAMLGCAAFSMATSFTALLLARIFCGIGVSACLMAPLTAYRRWFEASTLMRTNSWMLMTGSLGMVASTLPVQWLLPIIGWRALFWALAVLVLGSMLLIAWLVPQWHSTRIQGNGAALVKPSYALIWKHPYFLKMAPIGFFCYGGLVAIQTLWAAPWMIKVTGHSPLQSAGNLFWINVAMLCTFWVWGMINPWLTRNGFDADRLIARGLPSSFVVLAIITIAGPNIPSASGALWALYCMSCTFVALAQPAVSMAFEATLAGRALSAYNLVIFVGVFVVQWGIGLAIDAFKLMGLTEVQAYQSAMGVFLLCSVLSYVFFLNSKSHNEQI
jgi:MFS family permease